jgi:[FeFe] hydrogenase H-cluster maturation GTPase HydF
MSSKVPRSERIHIAIFGRRNSGKSTLINALAGQQVAVTSPVPGTTTDPVYKAMEILPVGPVVLIDTAGLDDDGTLGELRVAATRKTLRRADVALLVIDPALGISEFEREIAAALSAKDIPFITVVNKSDLYAELDLEDYATDGAMFTAVISAKDDVGIFELREDLARLMSQGREERPILGDLLEPGDVIILVCPIDRAAPKGRLILPQVQAIRDALDNDVITMVVKETELKQAIESLKEPPKLVVTDSQAFAQVARDTPEGVMLTSFSILFARYKGDLTELVKGTKTIRKLRPGDRVLIAEACTHHVTEDDIGTIKIPRWLNELAGGELQYDFVHGGDFAEGDLSRYKLIVLCGGCMVNRREVLSRIETSRISGVPVINYGVLISYVTGVFPRALEPFPEVLASVD